MRGLEMVRQTVMAASRMALRLPENLGRSIFASLGLVLYKSWLPERQRIFETIDRICFRLDQKLSQPLPVIVKRNFIHFALNIYELMRFPGLTNSQLNEKVTFHGLENLDQALAQGRGVVFALPHIGNWEILGAAIAHRGYPLNSFFMAQKADELGGLLDHFRSYSGIRLHDRDRGGIKALKALRNGEILGMIADQDGSNQGVYLDFLGHFVSIPAGPANWSLKTGALVVPLYSLRRGLSDKFDAWFLPALPDEEGETHHQRVVARTRRICDWMQELILKYPQQYLWFYDRFKPRHEAWVTAGKQRDGQFFHDEAWYG